jgi:hypothetical protein
MRGLITLVSRPAAMTTARRGSSTTLKKSDPMPSALSEADGEHDERRRGRAASCFVAITGAEITPASTGGGGWPEGRG